MADYTGGADLSVNFKDSSKKKKKKKKKGKKKDHGFFGDIGHALNLGLSASPLAVMVPGTSAYSLRNRFVRDINDAIHGTPTALKVTGGAIGNDATLLLRGPKHKRKHHKTFQLDDLVGAVAGDYKRRYWQSPDKIIKEAWEHPLAPVLDLATILTAGGAAAGKAGQTLAITGKAGGKLSKAGAKVAALQPIGTDATMAAKVGTKVGRNKVVFAPKTIEIQSPLSKGKIVVELKRNPTKRVGQKARATTRQKLGNSKLPVVGVGASHGIDARIAKNITKQERLAVNRDLARDIHGFDKAWNRLNRKERMSLRQLAAGYSPKEEALARELTVDTLHPKMQPYVNRRIKQLSRIDIDQKNMSDNMRAAVVEAKRLSEKNTKLIEEHAPEIADPQAVRLDARIARAKESLQTATGPRAKRLEARISRMEKQRSPKSVVNVQGRAEHELRAIVGDVEAEKRIAEQGLPAIFTNRSAMKNPRGMTVKGVQSGQRPAETMRHTGANFQNARNINDARILKDTNKTLQKFSSQERILKKIEGMAEVVDLKTMREMGGDNYVPLARDTKTFKQMQDFIDAADGPIKELYGDEVAGLMTQRFQKLIDAGAAAGDDGKVLAVPKAMMDVFQKEVQRTNPLARRLIDNPTNVWRTITLNLRPAWLTNNFLGQYLLALYSGGPGVVRDLVAQGVGKNKQLLDEYAGGLKHQGFISMEGVDFGKVGKRSAALRALKWTPENMGKINALLTDDIPRRALFLKLLRPEVRKLRKAMERQTGEALSFNDAARMILKDTDNYDRIAARVVNDLIDFADLSPFERNVVRRAIPFYSWLKGITKRTGQITVDSPWLASATNQFSKLGLEHNQEAIGDRPSYLKGALPLWDKPRNGQIDILTTQGMNPFATVSDVISIPSDGRMLLSSVNPIPKVFGEGAANMNFFTGQKIDPTGQSSWPERTLKQAVGSVPLTQTYAKANPDSALGMYLYPYKSKHPMYDADAVSPWWGYFGIPRKRLNIATARRIYGLEQRQKKGDVIQ